VQQREQRGAKHQDGPALDRVLETEHKATAAFLEEVANPIIDVDEISTHTTAKEAGKHTAMCISDASGGAVTVECGRAQFLLQSAYQDPVRTLVNHLPEVLTISASYPPAAARNSMKALLHLADQGTAFRVAFVANPLLFKMLARFSAETVPAIGNSNSLFWRECQIFASQLLARITRAETMGKEEDAEATSQAFQYTISNS